MIPTTYIKCKYDNAFKEDYYQKISNLLPKHDLITIESDHEAMFSNPMELAKIFEDV